MQKFQELKTFLDKRGYADVIDYILEDVGNLCLEGDSGCGKTQLVHDFCESRKLKLLETSLTADTTRWELVASDTLKSGTTEVRPGIVMEWLDCDPVKEGYEGVVMYWDGFNYASPNVTALLESLADFRGIIRIYEKKQVFKRSPRHYFIISMNPYEKAGYAGTFQSNIAQRRRFETIRMDWLDALDETELLAKRTGVEWEFARRMTAFAALTRNAYRNGELTVPVTTGNLINYCTFFKKGLDEETIINVACGLFLSEEEQKVHSFWGQAELADTKKKAMK